MPNNKTVNSNRQVVTPMIMGMPNNAPNFPQPAPQMMGAKAGANQTRKNVSSNKKGKKKISDKERAVRSANQKIKVERQKFAYENYEMRAKVDAVQPKKRGIDNSYYTIEKPKKVKKQKDFFYIMRKPVSFVMFVLLLVLVAIFALGYINIDGISGYASIYQEVPVVEETPEDATTEDTEGETEAEADNAEDETTEGEESTEGEEGATEEEEKPKDVIPSYSAMDPIFGFIKHLSGELMGEEIVLGESPLFDSMMAKREMGMKDTLASTIMFIAPVFLIIYFITALVMMFKALFSIFGKRVYKKFGLGSFVLLICAIVVLLSGVAYTTDLSASMNFGSAVSLLMGALSGTGFVAGFGLLGMVAVPVVVMLLSLICKKKIPYSIFDR